MRVLLPCQGGRSVSTALTEFERRALTALNGRHPDLPAMAAARLIWPDSPVWTAHNNRRRGALAMQAGSRLRRLRERGLVADRWGSYQGLWTITEAGRKALAE